MVGTGIQDEPGVQPFNMFNMFNLQPGRCGARPRELGSKMGRF
jgi:hypothetical protein